MLTANLFKRATNIINKNKIIIISILILSSVNDKK
jgi:hypothetical protein